MCCDKFKKKNTHFEISCRCEAIKQKNNTINLRGIHEKIELLTGKNDNIIYEMSVLSVKQMQELATFYKIASGRHLYCDGCISS